MHFHSDLTQLHVIPENVLKKNDLLKSHLIYNCDESGVNSHEQGEMLQYCGRSLLPGKGLFSFQCNYV